MFGEKMKKARLKRGYTQEYMAEKLGVNKGTVSHYEKGKTFPNEEKLVRVSKVLNVSFDYLLGEQSDIDALPEKRIETFQKDEFNTREKVREEAFELVDETIKRLLDIRKTIK
jgi:transcriptional regulator with XRE-family HTH domain